MGNNLSFADFLISIIVIIVGILIYTLLRKRETTHTDESRLPISCSDGYDVDSSQDENWRRLFDEYMKAFEEKYLAYLLRKEALRRDFPLATLEDFAQQYGAIKSEPPYTPNLDLPKKGVPSDTVSKLMDAWLVANDDMPTNGLPSFRVRRIIKARLDRQVAEICDKVTQTH